MAVRRLSRMPCGPFISDRDAPVSRLSLILSGTSTARQIDLPVHTVRTVHTEPSPLRTYHFSRNVKKTNFYDSLKASQNGSIDGAIRITQDYSEEIQPFPSLRSVLGSCSINRKPQSTVVRQIEIIECSLFIVTVQVRRRVS